MREIWDGTGDADGKAYWTLNNGEMKGRPYVRQRAVRALATWGDLFPLSDRKATLAATVDNDAWMASRNGQTVGSVLFDVTGELTTYGTVRQ